MILNPEILPEDKKYCCSKDIADYLISQGFPIFALDKINNQYIFAKTQKLIDLLSSISKNLSS